MPQSTWRRMATWMAATPPHVLCPCSPSVSTAREVVVLIVQIRRRFLLRLSFRPFACYLYYVRCQSRLRVPSGTRVPSRMRTRPPSPSAHHPPHSTSSVVLHRRRRWRRRTCSVSLLTLLMTQKLTWKGEKATAPTHPTQQQHPQNHPRRPPQNHKPTQNHPIRHQPQKRT